MEVRRFRESDKEQVKELIDSIMQREFSQEDAAYPREDLEDINRTYGGKREAFFVAEKENKIIGTVAIKEEGNGFALLRRIFVHPEHRSQGYGKILVDTAVDFCQQCQYRVINFRTTDRMKQAIELCKQKGFSERTRIDFGQFQIVKLSRVLKEGSGKEYEI